MEGGWIGGLDFRRVSGSGDSAALSLSVCAFLSRPLAGFGFQDVTALDLCLNPAAKQKDEGGDIPYSRRGGEVYQPEVPNRSASW